MGSSGTQSRRFQKIMHKTAFMLSRLDIDLPPMLSFHLAVKPEEA